LFTEIVSVELPGAVTGLLLKPAVTLDGSPETLNVTEPPPFTVTTTGPLDPRDTVSFEEDNEMPKIVTETVVEWTPPLPLIVTV